MKCRVCEVAMEASNPKRGWLCPDCRYLYDAAYRARRKAAGIKTSGSRTWDPAKRAAWWEKNADEQRKKRAARMRGYRKDPVLRPKHEARWKVSRALKTGRLVRQPCRCGATDSQAHHRDYSMPLEVEWLCRPCHDAEHARARGGK